MIKQNGIPVYEAIIHCCATRPDWMHGSGIEEKAEEIDRWHKDRWPSGLGYHRLIDRDGSIFVGRSLYQQGVHVRGHNRGTIGICLIGGHGSAATDRFEDHFTPAQDQALRGYLQALGELTPLSKITGHNEYAAKACPGFMVPEWL